MSARKMRRDAERREAKRMQRAVITAARAQGCVCVRNPHVVRDGLHWRVSVVHEDWCPASTMLAERGLAGERQLLVVVLPEGRTP